MKFIAKNKFYILFAILRFCMVFIFVLFLQNWSIDFDNPVYGTRDITYYYGNIEFLLGQSDTYYPQYSVKCWDTRIIFLVHFSVFNNYFPKD